MNKNTFRKTSRRRFLKQSLFGALGAGLAWHLGTEPVRAAIDRLRIGAIGVGGRGAENLTKLADEQIVALCDVDATFLQEAGKRFPDAKPYRDFREMFEKETLDAVVISTPDHTHAPIATEAMRRGLHVYCEKPLAHSIHETRVMSQLAAEMRVVTQMGNQHHGAAGYRRAMELMRSGSLGPVREVHCWTDRPLWPQGVGRPEEKPPVPETLDWDLWLGPAPERSYSPAYHPYSWRGWWDFGTGALGDIGPHAIDPIFWGLELDLPERIEAASSPVNEETAPQWSTIRFEFPERGDLPPVRLHWYDGGKKPAPELGPVRDWPPAGALVIGQYARIYLPETGEAPIVIPQSKTDQFKEPESFLPESPGHWAEWVMACKAETPTGSDFQYGARLTEVCLLGNIALRVGKPFRWDSQTHSSPDCPEVEQYLRRKYRKGWTL